MNRMNRVNRVQARVRAEQAATPPADANPARPPEPPVGLPPALRDPSVQIERIDQDLHWAGQCEEEARQRVARLSTALEGLQSQQTAAQAAPKHDKPLLAFLRQQICQLREQLSMTERDIAASSASILRLQGQRQACVAAIENAQALVVSRPATPPRESVLRQDARLSPAAKPTRPHRTRRVRKDEDKHADTHADMRGDKGKERADPLPELPIMPPDTSGEEFHFIARTAFGAAFLGSVGFGIDRWVGLPLWDTRGLAPIFAILGAMGYLTKRVAGGERMDSPIRLSVLVVTMAFALLEVAHVVQLTSEDAGAGQSRPSPL
jgi:hypothetical protein